MFGTVALCLLRIRDLKCRHSSPSQVLKNPAGGARVTVFMRLAVAVASESNIVALHSARIEAEAAAWIARLDGEGANEGDRAAFQGWCKLSDRHLTAVERLATLWSDMDCLRNTSSTKPHATPTSANAQEQVPVRT